MKTTGSKNSVLTPVLAAVFFALLIGLTWGLISTLSRSSRTAGQVPFDLERITAQRDSDPADVTQYLLPEFIGVTAGGERLGISAHANTMNALFSLLYPVLSECVSPRTAEAGTQTEWLALADEADSVYLRFHTELPDLLIGLFADLYTGRESNRTAAAADVYEMFVLPYREENDLRLAARSAEGEVVFYRLSAPEAVLNAEDLKQFVRSYRSAMTPFTFAGEDYAASSETEPVFLEPVTSRNMLITGGTALMIRNSRSEAEQLLRLFDVNPDKLLTSHTEPDGTGSYIDAQGVVYVRQSAFEYAATGDGVPVENWIGYTEPDSVSLTAYIRAALAIVAQIRGIGRNYTGGDAGMFLSELSSENGRVTVTLRYAFDNVRIAGLEPAFTAVFENGRLTEANLYTAAVRGLGDRRESMNEWWFFDYAERTGVIPRNVGLVYRSDFTADSISAEWSALAVIPQ